MPVVLYGALPYAPRRLGVLDRFRRGLRIATASSDLKRSLRQAQPLALNYRSFDSSQPSNVGDYAISKAIEEMLRQQQGKRAFEYVLWDGLESLARKEQRTINFTGGGYLFLSTEGRLSPRVRNDIAFASRHHNTLNLIGIGVNQPQLTEKFPQLCDDDRHTIRDIIQMSRTVCVRDEFSRQIIQDAAGIDVPMLGDPALHLSALLGIRRTQPPNAGRRLRVGVNLSLHGPTSNQILNKNFYSYVKALVELQQSLDVDLYYMQHHAAEAALPALLREAGLRITHCGPGLTDLLETYASLDLHIGGMLHSCILALSVDTPCIALAYDIKHRGLFELFNMPQSCLFANDFRPDQLLEHIHLELNEAAQRSAQIRSTRLALAEAYAQHMRGLPAD